MGPQKKRSRELVFKHPEHAVWKSGTLSSYDILKNKRGSYVPKRKSITSQDIYYGRGKFKNRKSSARQWIQSVQEAKRDLNIPPNTFVPIGGKSAQGQKLLKRSRLVHAKKIAAG